MNSDDQLLYLASLPQEIRVNTAELDPLVSRIRNWDALIRKAVRHRLQLRFYSFLKQRGADSFLEPETWQKIRSAAFWAQANVLAHEGELRRLLPLLRAEGIEVLLLKGAALLQTVYKRKTVRSLVDLDLLIHRENLFEAQEILRREGYEARPVFLSQWESRTFGGIPLQSCFGLIHSGKGTHVDLHVEPFEAWSRFSLKQDWLWENAESVSIDESTALIPSPSCLFLHLLLHFVKHTRAKTYVLGWLLDLDEWLRYAGGQINGSLCCEVIQHHDKASNILEVLAFLNAYLFSPLPQDLRQLLKEKRVNPLRLDQIFAPAPTSSSICWNNSETAERFLTYGSYYWGRVSSFRKKIRLLRRLLFPEREYLHARYSIRNSWERLGAFGKHLFFVLATAAGVGVYLLGKGISNLKTRYPFRKTERVRGWSLRNS